MRTDFTPEQLDDPVLHEAEQNLRKCVHCGFCTATCPTYVLLGDERDSPRGRIVLIQNMLEAGEPPKEETVLHIDRCLSCLGCVTACPSGVDYARLVDAARVHIAKTYKRPFAERAYRGFVLRLLTSPLLFGVLSFFGRTFAGLTARIPGRLGKLARKVPVRRKLSEDQRRLPDARPASRRIAIVAGCVQRALAPGIDLAARRVLARSAMSAAPLRRAGCCGSLNFHMGDLAGAKDAARRLILAFENANADGVFDAIVMNATGCTAFMKDYGHLFAGDGNWESRARFFAAKVRDFVEIAEPLAQPQSGIALLNLGVAYHPPCSLQHGQRIHGHGEKLLAASGFRLVPFADAHLCCGSAGSYSLLQPEISDALRARKLAAIKTSGAGLIASGNLGCINHLSGAGAPPAVHIAELLDWAGGGPKPAAMGED